MVALSVVLGASNSLAAECTSSLAPCVDAEPLWLPAGGGPFQTLPNTQATPAGEMAVELGVMLRLRPALLLAPAPNREGREVKAVGFAADGSLGWSLGLGGRWELSGAMPLGLYQSGAGIKGVTYQQAPPVARAAVRDPRFGLGYALLNGAGELGAKARLELKVPLGDPDALASEATPVLCPTVALALRRTGWLLGAELGARLRGSSTVFGSRIGSQGFIALGIGYELAPPRVSFALEAYALPSLVAPGDTLYLPAEWLGSVSYSPASEPELSFGIGAGTGLPISRNDAGESFAAFGVPALRGFAFAQFAPD